MQSEPIYATIDLKKGGISKACPGIDWIPLAKKGKNCYTDAELECGERESEMTYTTHSPQETEALGEQLGRLVWPGAVIAYTGDLGAGKTAFTRGLARGLGIDERVTSPTFTIVDEHLGGRLPLFHFDLYRLSSSDDLYDIGWEDYQCRGGVCAVEWSEVAEDLWEESTIRVDLRRGSVDSERTVTITGVEGL
ncbi:MAG: tRNA (adenosine(37)-N6)-threonylcarbamoyltransferase complex ATPase subunit type 1 TsaE [Candidatus Onthomonas sp.]